MNTTRGIVPDENSLDETCAIAAVIGPDNKVVDGSCGMSGIVVVGIVFGAMVLVLLVAPSVEANIFLVVLGNVLVVKFAEEENSDISHHDDSSVTSNKCRQV